jgi:hypothetical protein
MNSAMRRIFLVLLLGSMVAWAEMPDVKVEVVTIPVSKVKELGLTWLFRERVEINPMSPRVPDGGLFDPARPICGTFTAPQIAMIRRMLAAEKLALRPVELPSNDTLPIPGSDGQAKTVQLTQGPEETTQVRVTASDSLQFEEAVIPSEATLILANAGESAASVDVWLVSRSNASEP